VRFDVKKMKLEGERSEIEKKMKMKIIGVRENAIMMTGIQFFFIFLFFFWFSIFLCGGESGTINVR